MKFKDFEHFESLKYHQLIKIKRKSMMTATLLRTNDIPFQKSLKLSNLIKWFLWYIYDLYRENICFYISVVIRPYIYRADISPKLKSLKYYIYGSIYAACENFHISIKKCKIPAYIGQNMNFGKFSYIGQYWTCIYRSIYEFWYWPIYVYIFRINFILNWPFMIDPFESYSYLTYKCMYLSLQGFVLGSVPCSRA